MHALKNLHRDMLNISSDYLRDVGRGGLEIALFFFLTMKDTAY